MVARAIVVVVVAVLAGCGASTHGSSRSSGGPLECGPVVASLFARSESFVAQILTSQPAMAQQLTTTIDKLEPMFVAACRDERWSDALLRCIDRIEVTDDPHKCNHLFTTDQAVALGRRIVTAMTPRER